MAGKGARTENAAAGGAGSVETIKQKVEAAIVKGSLCELFERAIIRGDLAEVREALRRGANPLGEGLFGFPKPLFVAIRANQLECLEELLSASVERCEGEPLPRHHKTNGLLFKAISEGSLACCEMLLNKGWKVDWDRNPNWERSFCQTPLGFACEKRRSDVAALLIRRGASAKWLWPELKSARKEGQTDLVSMLEQAGCPATGWKALEARLSAQSSLAAWAIKSGAEAAGWLKSKRAPAPGTAALIGPAPTLALADFSKARRLIEEGGLGESLRIKWEEALRLARELSEQKALPLRDVDAADLKRLWEVNIPMFLEAFLVLPEQERERSVKEGELTPCDSAAAMLEKACALMSRMRLRSLEQARLRLEAEMAVMEHRCSKGEDPVATTTLGGGVGL